MSLALALLLTGSAPQSPLWVDDVFSAYTYTGNGGTQTITNGIDLAGKGGLVWTKGRSAVSDNNLFDTIRGGANALQSNGTGAQIALAGGGVTAFNADGFSLGSGAAYNNSGTTYVSWTFRKAAKFFDFGTYTGDGVAGRQIPHGLQGVPGMIIFRQIGSGDQWWVWHRSAQPLPTTNDLRLNTTNALTAHGATFMQDVTGAYWQGGNTGTYNGSGASYVWYAFAHDTAADGIIQCGSFANDGSSNATVTLGWEPQWVLIKAVGTTSNWFIHDMSRGWPTDGTRKTLYANLSDAEADSGSGATNYIGPTATGFTVKGSLDASQSYCFVAIRRPNKPPTSGTQVYNPVARTGTGSAVNVTGAGFAPDVMFAQRRSSGSTLGAAVIDRLRGPSLYLDTAATAAETNSPATMSAFGMDGVTLGTAAGLNTSGEPYIHHFLKRAPGFMDEVCYTGTGAARTVAHSLKAVPELMIVKKRSGADNWPVYAQAVGNGSYLAWNKSDPSAVSAAYWNNTTPTAAEFTVGTSSEVNGSGATYVAYLFASLPGISKVGSYVGNGGSLDVDCGFSNGARFVLIKRTGSTGQWWVFDTARGIVAAADPDLALNLTQAEQTTRDSIDPYAPGFTAVQNSGTDVNINGGQYIFLAIS